MLFGNPSRAPPPNWMWLALQVWVGTPSCCLVEGKWPRLDEGARGVTVAMRIHWLIAWSEGEAVSAPEGAEVGVVGVVLHHQDDDVLDLGQAVRVLGTTGVRTVGSVMLSLVGDLSLGSSRFERVEYQSNGPQLIVTEMLVPTVMEKLAFSCFAISVSLATSRLIQSSSFLTMSSTGPASAALGC